MKDRTKLVWRVYDIRVTLVGRKVKPEDYATSTAIIETCTVMALDDHMAGTLACKNAEEKYPTHYALMYEKLKERIA